MNDAYFLQLMMKQRQAEYGRMAELARLRARQRSGRGSYGERTWVWLGDHLIHLGQIIKSKYGPRPALLCESGGPGGCIGPEKNHCQGEKPGLA